MEYGYVRVSTKDQNEERQIQALKKYGLGTKGIFTDKASGRSMDRPAWKNLLLKCHMGDTIVIKELDRLGRNLLQIKDTYESLAKKGIHIKILDNDMLSTQGKSKVEIELVQPLLIHILGYIAEKEREKLLQRQKEALDILPKDDKGRMIGKTGLFIGRPNKQENITKEQKATIKRWIEKGMTCSECSELTKLSKSTLYRIKRRMEYKD